MADFGLGGSTGSGTTPGGYAPNPGKQSKTGYYKSNPVPLLPSPVTRREMQRGAQNAQYTYRGYQVPDFSNSQLVGLPPNSGMALENGVNTQQLLALGNTKQNLQAIGSWNTAQVQALQKRMVENGWLPKSEVSGRPTDRTMSAVAFMMQQGNALNARWTDVMYMGPKGLKQAGGTDATAVTTGVGPGGQDMSPTTTTASQVDYSTKAQARKYLREALANVLGRGPKDDEVDDFLDKLRAKERQNPSTGTTVTTPGVDGSDSQSTTSGGFGEVEAATFAENYAEDINPKRAKKYAQAGYEQLLDSLIAGG